jgi:hypothetical protein
VDPSEADRRLRQSMAYSPGQRLLKLTGAREPEHRLDPPVPVVARIVWEHDGEEHIETEAAGWSGQLVYVRVPDTRYRLTSVWLNTADVRRRALRVRRERPAPLAGAGRLCCAADHSSWSSNSPSCSRIASRMRPGTVGVVDRPVKRQSPDLVDQAQ